MKLKIITIPFVEVEQLNSDNFISECGTNKGEEMTLKEIVKQLEFCKYITNDNLHTLDFNLAFKELKKRAEVVDNDNYYIGQEVYSDDKKCYITALKLKIVQAHQFVDIIELQTIPPLPNYFCGEIVGVGTIRTPEEYKKFQIEEYKKSQIKLANDILDKYK